jgi:hypothetical protein
VGSMKGGPVLQIRSPAVAIMAPVPLCRAFVSGGRYDRLVAASSGRSERKLGAACADERYLRD